MKFPYFKTLALVGIIAVAWNCSSDSVDAVSDALNQGSGEVNPPAATNYWLIQGDVNYVVIPSNDLFIVTDTEGNNLGFYDVASASIIDATGTPIATGIILSDYPQVTPENNVVYPNGKITDMAGNVIYDPNAGLSSAQIPALSSAVIQDQPASSANVEQPKSSSSVQPDKPKSSSSSVKDQPKSSSSVKSSSSKEQPKSSSEEKQTSGSITATGSLNQTVAKGSSISTIVFSNVTQEPQRDWKAYFLQGKLDQNAKTYTVTGTVPGELGDGSKYTEKFTFNDGSFEVTITIGQGGQPKSSSSAKSSSSVKSSSSQQQPQSSSQGGGQSANINYKVKSGGRSGQGWGSRYWDCCMPHCAWGNNTGRPTKTCNAQMQEIGEAGGSVCSGGQGGVCDSQAPWSVSDNFAFAFAAVPAGLGGECGKCFLLTFDGGTHNGGEGANTGGLNGKKMIIMVSNIGGDVQSNQFDIMIPGGGVVAFNGCGTQLGISSTGAQYGGFITDCKSDPSCVKQKCSAFSKYPKLQAGCEFSATWMGGANNPTFKFEELESCPSEISSKW